MPKLKLISSPDWKQAILPNSGTSFSTLSPWSVINTGPHFAYTWAGVPSCVSGSSVPVGTVFASRFGTDGRARIKTDEWLVYVKQNNFIAQDVADHKTILDHYTEGIPSMFAQAPEQIKELFKKQVLVFFP